MPVLVAVPLMAGLVALAHRPVLCLALAGLIAAGVALLAYSPTVLDVLDQPRPISSVPRPSSPSDASPQGSR